MSYLALTNYGRLWNDTWWRSGTIWEEYTQVDYNRKTAYRCVLHGFRNFVFLFFFLAYLDSEVCEYVMFQQRHRQTHTSSLMNINFILHKLVILIDMMQKQSFVHQIIIILVCHFSMFFFFLLFLVWIFLDLEFYRYVMQRWDQFVLISEMGSDLDIIDSSYNGQMSHADPDSQSDICRSPWHFCQQSWEQRMLTLYARFNFVLQVNYLIRLFDQASDKNMRLKERYLK